MPSATPSNASGRSGVGDDQMGVIGKGILGTIQEGVGGTSSRQLYYGTGVAFYQAPSMQRSYGDDLRSFNVKQFGARGMVNLPRRWFEMGPTEIFFTYPINYAWAGPEYHVRYTPKTLSARTLSVNTPSQYVTARTTNTAQDLETSCMSHWLGEIGQEVRTGPNILPTYFWSGGVGFAFPAMIELNMGGGGNIIFDRYTNFAMIMASVPTISMRKDLMVMAGGGLYYDHETDYQELPVKFGWVPYLTDEGTSYNRNVANSASSDVGENMGCVWAPVEWNIHVPIKTPQTNYWNCLLSRKPIDTSCFASDLQYIIALGNFFEFTDTGTGLAHCPYYYPPLNIATNPSAIAADVQAAIPFYHPNQANRTGESTIAGGAGAYVYTRNLQDGWIVQTAQAGTPVGITPSTGPELFNAAVGAATIKNLWLPPSMLPPGQFYTGASPQLDFDQLSVFGPTYLTVPPIFTNTNGYYNAVATYGTGGLTQANRVTYVAPRNRICCNPRIWANHYRVCNGFVYGGYGQHRPKMAVPGTAAQTDNRYMKDVYSVSSGSTALPIQYPVNFTRMEFRNRSLKLTNPALSAKLPLQSAPQSCVYYPFSYGFSQTYRIPASQNPWDVAGFHRWTSSQVLGSSYLVSTGQSPIGVFQDALQVSNKITQNIIMPANPVTSMIVGIYREKDRRYLGMNTQGSYSPALFWNALNPVRSTLYDGGNIMFDYQSRKAQEFGSMVDRPDCLRIPFRGGLCQLDPQNILSSAFEQFECSTLSGDVPNGLRKSGDRNSRNTMGGAGANHGSRNQPIHCTEWYNCHLIEYPFCMHEPLGREGTVQSTPSFAKTILRMEFYIDALLKPQRGLDDMYDQTTKVPPYWYSGEWNYFGTTTLATGLPYNSTAGTQATATSLPYGPISYDGGGSVGTTTRQVTTNVSNTVPNAYILAPPSAFDMYSDDREPVVQSVRGTQITNSNATMGSNASSWNVNDGALVIIISFLQNQVWTISPLRTSILSTRG